MMMAAAAATTTATTATTVPHLHLHLLLHLVLLLLFLHLLLHHRHLPPPLLPDRSRSWRTPSRCQWEGHPGPWWTCRSHRPARHSPWGCRGPWIPGRSQERRWTGTGGEGGGTEVRNRWRRRRPRRRRWRLRWGKGTSGGWGWKVGEVKVSRWGRVGRAVGRGGAARSGARLGGGGGGGEEQIRMTPPLPPFPPKKTPTQSQRHLNRFFDFVGTLGGGGRISIRVGIQY